MQSPGGLWRKDLERHLSFAAQDHSRKQRGYQRESGLLLEEP
jgi:hypothetical protein